MNTTTTYASKIQFRNAAKKAGVRINTENEFSRMKLSIGRDYDINNKLVTAYDRIYNKVTAVGFEFYTLSADDALNLHAAGFELIKTIVPAEHGTKRTAFIYRLPLAN